MDVETGGVARRRKACAGPWVRRELLVAGGRGAWPRVGRGWLGMVRRFMADRREGLRFAVYRFGCLDPVGGAVGMPRSTCAGGGGWRDVMRGGDSQIPA